MNTRRVMILGLLVSATVGLLTGCETESVGDSAVSISPVSIGLKNGEVADFTASGGYEYSWSLADESKGLLSSRTGPTVRYTDRYEPETNSTYVQTLTVTSWIKGSSTGSGDTNTTGGSSYQATATAQIEHLSSYEAPEPADMYISPGAAEINLWTSGEFTVSGGDGNYFWFLGSPSYGRLSVQTGTKTTYTSTYDPGLSNTVLQIIYCRDGDGRLASANVVQKQ